MDKIDVVYLLVLVMGTFGLVSLLRYIQKEALAALGDVLYRQGDLQEYMRMLKSKKLGLVFRKGTLALLRLNGYLYGGDSDGIRDTFKVLDSVYLKPGEKLDYYQKKLSFFIMAGHYDAARETYKSLENLLIKETDEKLKAILKDAKLLLGVYVERDVGLIPQLASLEREQKGHMQGLTRYRLAKLYWYSGNTQKALEYLTLAAPNLAGTIWEPVIRQAHEDPVLLEER